MLMYKDEQGPMTLAINDSQMDLHVISFTGQEALNQPYRFDIDLVSEHGAIDHDTLLGRSAYLSFGPQPQGVHGQISEVSHVQAGTGLSLYRITLTPDLQRLANAPKARTFNGMRVPQIIDLLLQEHGLGTAAYRFERMIGVYPPRDMCVQYQETDLHLLQRLCEEEGISFRFEHNVSGHVLIFADDPASFPELSPSRGMLITDLTDNGQNGIAHFAERLTLLPSYSSHGGDNLAFLDQHRSTSTRVTTLEVDLPPAVVLPFGVRGDQSTRQRQMSVRALERLRCERRVISGRSSQPALVSGQIMQVTEHPDRLMNDQWLLTEIRHEGSQLAKLKGASAEDIAAIIRATQAIRALSWSPLQPAQSSAASNVRASDCQYRNEFSVIPWAMPFRPRLQHRKPAITGIHSAVLAQPHTFDALGRLAVRFGWQSVGSDQGAQHSWAALCSAVQIQADTTAVSVGFFDDDPDQPVICGVLKAATAEQLNADVRCSGVAEGDDNHVRLAPDQRLDLDSVQPITLHTARATIEIAAHRVTFHSREDD
jgi:type VI secretion system secreted protein VgrG